ncbi:glycosyltransferase [Herbiconiux sp. 11R-BC]|uniref:glycosyltransferase family 2 protein n=1 Tax=Herbiconiux sp. 11R-BC TaxID=3111637 RepID=UPI003C103B02
MIRNWLEERAKSRIRRRLLDGRFTPSDELVMGENGAEIPVLMCLWNRPERLRAMLESLDAQTGTPGIAVYLWNNNKVDHTYYRFVIREFEARGAVTSIRLVRTPYNLGSIARFYWARMLAATKGPGPIVVVDDDEDIRPDFVSTALSLYEPKTVHAWWAFTVNPETGDYFDRTPAGVGDRVHHVGPGGMICSSEIFLDDRFFTELPQRYWLLDDVWFTFFVTRAGYRLAKLPVEVEFVLAETNQHHNLGDLKREFYRSLRAL